MPKYAVALVQKSETDFYTLCRRVRRGDGVELYVPGIKSIVDSMVIEAKSKRVAVDMAANEFERRIHAKEVNYGPKTKKAKESDKVRVAI